MNKKIIQIFLLLIIISQININCSKEKEINSQKLLTIRDCINNFNKEKIIYLITDLDVTTQYIIDVHKYINRIEGNIENINCVKKQMLS